MKDRTQESPADEGRIEIDTKDEIGAGGAFKAQRRRGLGICRKVY